MTLTDQGILALIGLVAGVLGGLKSHLDGKPLRDEVSIIIVKLKGE